MAKRKSAKTGFQVPGQIALEDFDKIKAPRGKFMVVERSANNVTGWGYTKISTHPTRRSLLLAVNKQNEKLTKQSNTGTSVTLSHAIASISVLGIDSKGQVLKEL